MTEFTRLLHAPQMDDTARRCAGCRVPTEQAIDLAFAFQPIVDTRSGVPYAYETLVRGPNGEPANTVLSQVDDANRYHVDQRCRTVAIAQAAALGMKGFLSINFMPNAVYQPEACIRSTLERQKSISSPASASSSKQWRAKISSAAGISSRYFVHTVASVFRRLSMTLARDTRG